jgi:hypothetical protein
MATKADQLLADAILLLTPTYPAEAKSLETFKAIQDALQDWGAEFLEQTESIQRKKFVAEVALQIQLIAKP